MTMINQQGFKLDDIGGIIAEISTGVLSGPEIDFRILKDPSNTLDQRN
jgi:hypothetical protein